MPARLRVALVNDYEVIVRGLASMLAPFADRVAIVELQAGGTPDRSADVALFDTFAGRRYALGRARAMVSEGLCDHVVLYTWDTTAEFLERADEIGVSGVVLKSTAGRRLVDVLERIVRGERVGFEHVHRGRERADAERLSVREQEVLALLALGLTNREIGSELFLSEETIKTYVRRLYAKLGVRNRAQASLRAAGFDVMPPPHRMDGATRALDRDQAIAHTMDAGSRASPV